MSIELITGHGGTYHVDSPDAGAYNACVVGTGSYILSGCACAMSGPNVAHVAAGELLLGGRHVRVIAGEDLAIDNGTQGQKRRDLICARYTEASGVEGVALRVVKGTPAASPVDPAYDAGSILDGDSPVDVPLWRVTLDGITPGAPAALVKGVLSLADVAGEPRIRVGTKVVRVSTGENAARLWTQAEFATAFGRQFDPARDFVGVMNADGSASGAHVQGCTFEGGSLYAVQDITVAGPTDTRVNYLVALAS